MLPRDLRRGTACEATPSASVLVTERQGPRYGSAAPARRESAFGGPLFADGQTMQSLPSAALTVPFSSARSVTEGLLEPLVRSRRLPRAGEVCAHLGGKTLSDLGGAASELGDRRLGDTEFVGDLLHRRQGDLNEVLVHVGLRVTDEGKLTRGPSATTLPEAARHANSLRTELRRRGAHPEVLRFCTQEVLERNWFHASLEAAKSLPERLRSMTGREGDGAALVDAVLGLGTHGNPSVRINSLTTESERDEQKGFANLCKGVLGMFRNPTAHDPRLRRSVTNEELLVSCPLEALQK